MKNKIEVKLRGSGYKVSAFLINQSILKILKNASISEALYEDNPISLVKNIAKDYFFVTKGFDIDPARDLECTVSINEKKLK